MADKYLKVGTGTDPIEEIEATVTSLGSDSAGEILALDANGRIDITTMPVGFGPGVESISTSESLVAGDLVNIWDNSGTKAVRKADATVTGKPADGFVLAGVTHPGTATVYYEGVNNQVTGLTIGPQYLHTIAGKATATKPTASGNVQQFVGTATSATSMVFVRGMSIKLA